MKKHVSTAGRPATGGYPAKLQEKFWPPAAVLAWALWHSPAVVKECWGGSIETIRAKLDKEGPFAHVLDYAMERLRYELRQGSIYNSGTGKSGKRKPKTAEQWLGLWFATDREGPDYVTSLEPAPALGGRGLHLGDSRAQ
jgi:hypothetical protein